MKYRGFVIDYICPPIPIRTCDYIYFLEGNEEGEDQGFCETEEQCKKEIDNILKSKQVKTITIKIKVQSEITEDVTINLPYFTKGICHAYKVVSEKNAICVTFAEDESLMTIIGEGIRHGYAEPAFKENECTEIEFNQIYLSVMEGILKTFEDEN